MKRAEWLTMARALATACGLAACGCADGVQLAEVTGRVTFTGRPVPAEIIFEPIAPDGAAAGRPSSCLTAADGLYRLQYTRKRPGAVVGRHQVTVKIMRAAPDREPQSFQEAMTPVKVARLMRPVFTSGNRYDFAITP